MIEITGRRHFMPLDGEQLTQLFKVLGFGIHTYFK
jgi:hypothetical protein